MEEPGVEIIVPVLPTGMPEHEAVAVQRRLIDDLLAPHAGRRMVHWYYTPMAMGFAGHLEADLCVYDCMDELSGFRGAPATLLERERRLFERADLVFTGGQSLYEAKRDRHHSVHAFPSSIDRAHFAGARAHGLEEPADQRHIPGPRLGFFGVIDERLDINLLAAAADLRPDWSFVMIGPVVKIDPATLPRRPNIHYLGSRKYGELPAYLSGWDVGFMPFALNEATRFISPTKTPEFLASGLPVVCTPITDVIRPYGETGLVEIAATPEQVVAKAAMLMARPREPWLAAVDGFLAGTSWDRTWDAMHSLVAAHLDGTAPRQSAPDAAKGSLHV